MERGRHIRCTACRTLFPLDDATVIKDYTRLDPPAPDKIGPYPVERFLGKNNLGRVYKGKDPDRGSPVAVQTLSPEYAGNAAFRKRFEENAQICSRIDHPNIVRIFRSGTDKSGLLYLAMEYIAGGTVHDMLDRSGPLSPEKTAEIAIAVCAALSTAQKNGIVFRDIRPDNILVTSNGKFKLANQGLAECLSDREEQNTPKRNPADHKEDTLELTSLGTPEYMAPEQSIDANHCDVRADIYSLGVSMYQMLSGHLPFETADRNELRRQHFEVEPKIPSVHRPDIPIDMEYIVMMCLRKKKTERYQTPEELLTDLDAFMDGLPLPSANDNTLAAGSGSYGKYIHTRKDIIVKNRSRTPWNVLRWFELAAIFFLTLATAWLLLERSQIRAGQTKPQAGSHLVTTRADIWDTTRKNAAEALRTGRGFADAIVNLKSFENDADDARKKEVADLLKKLHAASAMEVRKLMKRLDQEALQYCMEHDYRAALMVFERDNPLFAESRKERTDRIGKIRKMLEDFSKQQEINREFLGKFVIPHLVAGDYAKAMERYKSKENPYKDEAVLNILQECIQIPDKFANAHQSLLNTECKYSFRTEPFDSWSKQGNMKFMLVDAPGIYLHGHGENPFTIHDLTAEDQEYVLSNLKNISEPALALWNIGANCHSAPEKAEKFITQIPFSLRESYTIYLRNKITSNLIKSFQKDLRTLLTDVGYSSNDLPDPEQLPKLNIFETVEPELYILRIDNMLITYDNLPLEERAYLNALRIVRTEMENRLNSSRQEHPHEREFNHPLQENR